MEIDDLDLAPYLLESKVSPQLRLMKQYTQLLLCQIFDNKEESHYKSIEKYIPLEHLLTQCKMINHNFIGSEKKKKKIRKENYTPNTKYMVSLGMDIFNYFRTLDIPGFLALTSFKSFYNEESLIVEDTSLFKRRRGPF